MNQNKKLDEQVSAQIKANVKEQAWYKNYCKCLSYLAGLNVASWKDIDSYEGPGVPLITTLKKYNRNVDERVEIVANTEILGTNTTSLIKLLNDMCTAFNIKIETSLSSSVKYYAKAPGGGGDYTELLDSFRKRLKIVSDEIRKKFKVSNSGNVEPKLSDDQLFELISQTQEYKEYVQEEQKKEQEAEQKAINGSQEMSEKTIPIKESDIKNIDKINDQKKDLEKAKKQEKADNWIEVDTACEITDQIWYCNYMNCLSFLVNLNVENSNDITAVWKANNKYLKFIYKIVICQE